MLEQRWVVGDIPNGIQPKVLPEEWMQKMLESASATYTQMAKALKINREKMDQHFGFLEKPIECETGDKVMCKSFRETARTLFHLGRLCCDSQ